MTKKILVTGGAGFIGRNFIHFVLNHSNYHVTNIDAMNYAGNLESIREFNNNPNYRFIKGDISILSELNQVFDQDYDCIINFAAESHVDRSINDASPFLNTNIMGTFNLLETVRSGKAKQIIQISTDEVYGTLNKNDPGFTEKTSISPNNPYSASKASADLLVRSYNKTHLIPALITRCSNNYGPYQHPEKLIPKTIMNAYNDVAIPIYGDGMQIRDWLFVEDHCHAIFTVMEKGIPGEVYNIGGMSELTNLEIVKFILNYLGKSSELISFVEDRKGHDRRYSINWNKMNKELGWKPRTSIEEGLKRTIEWYKKNQPWIKKSLSSGDMK